MIKRLESTLPTFKTLAFRPGLNILVAEKSPGATDRQTRNGVGKTSFVDLVHFLFGSDVRQEHFLSLDVLASESYGAIFDLAGKPVEIARSPAKSKDIFIKQGDVSDWPRQPKLRKQSGDLVLSNSDWKVVLGALMFNLMESEESETLRFGPSFRSLFSYFARRQNAGGLQSPDQQSTDQQLFDQQVNLTYLLGLDSSIPRELQEVRRREKALGEFKKAAKEGAFGELVGKAADLRTKLTIRTAKVTRLRSELESFHVVPQYKEYEEEASRLTAEISSLSNDNEIDTELIGQLREAVATETPPRFANVKRAYEEAGITLPGLVVKRFDEVERFHKSIVENRRSHLRSEIEAAEDRCRERERQKEMLGERRAQIMTILRSGGALEHFSRLQTELTFLEAEAASLQRRFEAAEMLERKGAELEIERARLHKRLQDDHYEQREVIGEAIMVFEEISNALYERAGSLVISPTPNGPALEVKIEGARSKGINNMQMFCFDMMLMVLCAQRGFGPGFLIHDSHLFDGVDERQVARALEVGAERAEKLGFQYIVTMNEDAIPRSAFVSSFELEKYLVETRLTDATNDGGLFGIRFD